MKKIAFVNMTHMPFDDRTFYHQAYSMLKHSCVTVISAHCDMKSVVEGVYVDSFDGSCLSPVDKIKEVRIRLSHSKPDVIVCDNPIAIIAAVGKKTKRVIVYDITERYPANHNLVGMVGLKRIMKKMLLTSINICAAFLSDRFIFGEYYKSFPFKVFFWKKKIKLPYFPYLEYIKQYPLKSFKNGIDLLYSGVFNEDRGGYNVLNVVSLLAKLQPESTINLKLIVSFETEIDKQYYQQFLNNVPSNVYVEQVGYLPFKDYCLMIGDCHFLLDLRNLRNTYSLPIKLFYYLACGRPIVFSDLKAIRKEIDEIDFGYLVDPDDIESICRFIIDCVNQPDLYLKYAQNARRAAEEKYNWKMLENKFVEFVLQ